MSLVEDYESVIQRSAAHVGKRSDLDGAASEQLWHRFWVKHLVQGIKERPEVRVDLVVQGSRKKTESLSRLDCGSSQNDATDFFALQGLNCLGHRQVGLSGSGRANTEHNRVLID